MSATPARLIPFLAAFAAFLAFPGASAVAASDATSLSPTSFKPSAKVIANKTVRRRDVTLPAPVDSIKITARGRACFGKWPIVRLRVAGRLIGRYEIKSKSPVTYTTPTAIAAGSRAVSVVLANAGNAKCKRRVRLDDIDFHLVRDPAAAAPGVTAAGANPAPSTSGNSGSPVAAGGSGSSGGSGSGTGAVAKPGTGALPNARLVRWTPPQLVNPTTIQLNAGAQWVGLDKSKDYILKMPATRKPGLTIYGGHNVVVIGGALALSRYTALYVEAATGTVHLEGLSIDNAGRGEGDGITINAPQATVQIQNTRVVNITGSYDGEHGDMVQPWGGAARLRIDHFSGSTNYQGLFLRPDKGPIGSIELSNIDLDYNATAPFQGGDLLWLGTDCKTPPVTLSEVHVGKTHPYDPQGHSVWPKPANETCPSVVKNGRITFPSLPVSGAVTLGAPTDYAPSSVVGTGYVTPGYVG